MRRVHKSGNEYDIYLKGGRGFEDPEHDFFVKFHKRSYVPDGVPMKIPASDRIAWVKAETAEGAISICRYHYFKTGSQFRIAAYYF